MPCLLGLSFGFLTKSSRQSVLLSKTENPSHPPPPPPKCWHFEDDCVLNVSIGKVAASGVLIYSLNMIINKFEARLLPFSCLKMVYLCCCSTSFVCANIIPIHKGSKANISDSDKYRSIAISSLLGKILDHIIIERQSKSLTTSKY